MSLSDSLGFKGTSGWRQVSKPPLPLMASALHQLLPRLSGIYRDPQRVLRDAESLLSSPLGHHLRPTTEPLLNNDGTATPPVLVLSGTLPMTYRGVTYNLPIDMFLPPPYPLRPPTVYVRPVSSMAIRENHRHVGLDGQVYLPYLHEWRPTSHDLCELAVWMSSTFGSDPPCYAKPVKPAASAAAAGSNAASYTSSLSSSYCGNTNASSADELRRIVIEQEIADANLAAETARKAAVEEARLEREAVQLKQQHDVQLSGMKQMAVSKVQFRMRQLFDESKVELRRELKDQKMLEAGKTRIDHLLKEGEERKALLIRENTNMDEAISNLETWIEAVQQQKDKSEAEVTYSDNEEKIDLQTLPADTISAQMLSLSAESAAIDDCIYFLDRALVKGSLPLDVFLKEVRKLSKRQFMAKAHLMKISQMKSLSR
ncbi:hypothetical protein ACHAXN_009387 [Cyclotella atomus]